MGVIVMMAAAWFIFEATVEWLIEKWNNRKD